MKKQLFSLSFLTIISCLPINGSSDQTKPETDHLRQAWFGGQVQPSKAQQHQAALAKYLANPDNKTSLWVPLSILDPNQQSSHSILDPK